jgi:hypothetical protein
MAGLDTVLTSVVNPGAALTATVPATGDSLTTRAFAPGSFAGLAGIIRDGVTVGTAQVKSPSLHDDVNGINFRTGELPSTLLLPRDTWQPLQPSDTLFVAATGGAAETDLVALVAYYSALNGISARLNAWSDISGLVQNIETIIVACTASATIGQWADTLITTTQNVLKAGYDYALLGYITDTPLGVIGLRGSETGNLRSCGPGTSTTYDTSEWFIQLSDRSGYPCIPVFNANNRASVFVSVADHLASTVANVTLITAQLSSPAPH